MTTRNSHLIVVGSGIAGLYSSLLAAEAGLRVTLMTKGALAQSNTHLAQGGICAVLGPEDAAPGDSVEAHIADTLRAGAGQCDPEVVRILCSEAGGDISALERFGVAFDRDPATGRRSLGLEGAHSAARILHAGGDATGAAIADGLIRSVRDAAALGTIRILANTFVQDLVLDGGHVTGVRLLADDGRARVLAADAVLLASGGAGQLFDFTTNPSVATADGLAAAWRAGAAVADLEYFQFHPTALAVGGNFLISEAVRGAGAVLRDTAGEAFMVRYHPEADLAPRDVVSRSIAAHLAGIHAKPGEGVFLDATGVEAAHGAGYLARRFPTIDARTRELGFDWAREWLPVTPAAHYWMGGVATTLDGQTSLPGLYAAGEVACTGVHGANRLASNSLLEGLVFGRRAVDAFVASTTCVPAGPKGTDAPGGTDSTGGTETEAGAWPVTDGFASLPGPAGPESEPAMRDSALPDLRLADSPAPVPFTRQALQRLMNAHAGVVRDAAGLHAAARQLATWRSQEPAAGTVEAQAGPTEAAGVQGSSQSSPAQAAAQLENMRLVAELLVQASLARENSIGAHYRSDFPEAPASGRSPAFSVSATGTEISHFPTSLPVLESETV